MKIKDIVERGLIMPQTIKPMGLIHLPGKGPNNRFDFKNKGNNRANEIDETKEAPPGTYFTKTGNLVKGRLTKAAKAKGARETDPKDNQRSKVPPATQRNEEEVHELDVRKTHGDRRIENPKTGNDIKLRTALKAKKGSQVYQTARKIYNRLKDKE